jgi:hypothetical protein
MFSCFFDLCGFRDKRSPRGDEIAKSLGWPSNCGVRGGLADRWRTELENPFQLCLLFSGCWLRKCHGLREKIALGGSATRESGLQASKTLKNGL